MPTRPGRCWCSPAVAGPFGVYGGRLATPTSQPAQAGIFEQALVPRRLREALGDEKLRKLHAALLAAIEAGQTITVKLSPRDGRAFGLTVAVDVKL